MSAGTPSPRPPLPDDRRRAVEKMLDTMPTHLIDLRGDVYRLVRTADLMYDLTISEALHNNWDVLDNDELPPEIRALFDYAILSHRWTEELDYKTVLKDGVPDPKGLCHGAYKLITFCQIAKTHGIAFAWSDTCCINKESSAELQEAINSMFSWYYHAKLCIVYLGGITCDGLPGEAELQADPWFTRGWTLQELLAPKCTKFYNKDWKRLADGDNDKSNETLLDAISAVTRIGKKHIQDFEPGAQNVRERMIWASKRSTTRIEDVAYCLLGIFKVNMPIIYGEKQNAFFRLQEEIMKKTSKRDIFNWTGQPSDSNTMLASHPSCFELKQLDQYPGYNRFQIFRFYSTWLVYVATYDLLVVFQDWLLSFTMGEIANVGRIGHTLTNVGIRTKLQLINVSRITPITVEPNDGYYVYDVKANALKTIRIETKKKLDLSFVSTKSSLFTFTGLTRYRIALLNDWAFGAFTGLHTKKCVAILLKKPVSRIDVYNFVRIPTREPMLVKRLRNKSVVPEIVYIR